MADSSSTRRRFVPLVAIAAIAAAVGLSVKAFSTTVDPALTSARSGTVIDGDTQAPLSGAHVVARWWHTNLQRFPAIGHGTAGGFANCLHREAAITDGAGRYTLPSIQGAFDVERRWDFSHKDEYRWQLNAYRAGYYTPTESDSNPVLHPAVNAGADGSVVSVAPLMLKKDTRPREERIAYLTGWGLDFSCKWTTTEPVAFFAEIYNEAFQLACQSGPPTGALMVARLRREARSAMSTLPRDIAQGLDEIQRHYGPNEPASEADNVRACELLTKAKENAS